MKQVSRFSERINKKVGSYKKGYKELVKTKKGKTKKGKKGHQKQKADVNGMFGRSFF